MYGFLNWAGDLGGFSSVIYLMFTYTANYIAQEDLLNYVVAKVFRKPNNKPLKFG